MKLINQNNEGFTLIEMLVVVAIVGLLSAVVVVGLTGAREKARDSRRVADIRQVQNQLEIDYTSAGYPAKNEVTLPEDPGTFGYAYEPNGQTYQLGACLESGESITGAVDPNDSTDCPDTLSCNTGSAFCVTPD